MIGERLRFLRLARGMSLDELAGKMPCPVSKQMLSRYERDLATPTPRMVTALAKAHGVPISRLLEAPQVRIETIAYRRQATLNARDQGQMTAFVTRELEQRVRVQEATGALQTLVPILSMKAECLQDAEMAANQLRKVWKLGQTPIANLIDELENRLVHVIEVDAPKAFDGLSLIAYERTKKPVAVATVVRKGVSTDRQRLSLAHELGHIVLKLSESVDEEKAAYRFASAFLAPAETLRRDVGETRSAIELGELAMLKQRYRMSLQALIYRMREIGIISDGYAQEWFGKIRAKGWREVEPYELSSEEPSWLRRSAYRAVAEGTLRRGEVAPFLEADFEEAPIAKSDKLELMKLSREERRKRLAESVAKSAASYLADSDWRKRKPKGAQTAIE